MSSSNNINAIKEQHRVVAWRLELRGYCVFVFFLHNRVGDGHAHLQRRLLGIARISNPFIMIPCHIGVFLLRWGQRCREACGGRHFRNVGSLSRERRAVSRTANMTGTLGRLWTGKPKCQKTGSLRIYSGRLSRRYQSNAHSRPRLHDRIAFLEQLLCRSCCICFVAAHIHAFLSCSTRYFEIIGPLAVSCVSAGVTTLTAT